MLTEMNIDVEMVVKFSQRGVGKLDGFTDDDAIGVFMDRRGRKGRKGS